LLGTAVNSNVLVCGSYLNKKSASSAQPKSQHWTQQIKGISLYVSDLIVVKAVSIGERLCQVVLYSFSWVSVMAGRNLCGAQRCWRLGIRICADVTGQDSKKLGWPSIQKVSRAE
jgi:hypothetical protein